MDSCLIQEKKGTKNDRTSCFVKGSGQDQYDKPAGGRRKASPVSGTYFAGARDSLCVSEKCKGTRKSAGMALADQAEEAPLILMSHTDVVAAQASQWKFPPFEAQEVDGYIYGRGTVDTKQLTAMELTAFLALKEKEIPLKRDVYFLATSDEESGSAYGLQWFLDHEITVGETTKTGRELFRGSDVISEGGGFPVVGGKGNFTFANPDRNPAVQWNLP